VDAQKFYNNIWGEETIHNGRYDKLSEEEQDLPKTLQIARAQELLELDFVELIKSKMSHVQPKMRIVDMGSGYGGLLRRLWTEGLVWSATGADISYTMCEQARRLNEQLGCSQDITILEESYLDISLPDDSVDVVISMDALLHVGPERQRRAMQEASRILRPGGWIIFTDIMQKEIVDPEEMKPIYDRINLSKMGTVSNYKAALEACGFTEFSTDLFSSNIAKHYGNVLEVLVEKGAGLGISEDYMIRMKKGLETWQTLAPENIEWGFMSAKKTQKVVLTKAS